MFKHIRNCFRLVCPRDWDSLKPTDEHNVRFCQSCSENVYLVENDADFIAHAQAGHCVAKALPNCHELPKMAWGRTAGFDIDYAHGGTELLQAILANQQKMEHIAWMDEAKDEAIALIDVAHTCPTCDFPMRACVMSARYASS